MDFLILLDFYVQLKYTIDVYRNKEDKTKTRGVIKIIYESAFQEKKWY